MAHLADMNVKIDGLPVIRFKMAVRKNLGDYNWVDFEAEATDHPRGSESASDAFKRVATFVDTELTEQVDRIIKEIQ